MLVRVAAARRLFDGELRPAGVKSIAYSTREGTIPELLFNSIRTPNAYILTFTVQTEAVGRPRYKQTLMTANPASGRYVPKIASQR